MPVSVPYVRPTDSTGVALIEATSYATRKTAIAKITKAVRVEHRSDCIVIALDNGRFVPAILFHRNPSEYNHYIHVGIMAIG